MRIDVGTDKTDLICDPVRVYYKWNGGLHSPMKVGSSVAVMYREKNKPYIALQSEVDWSRVAEFCILSGETNDGVMLQVSENQYELRQA